MTDKQAKREATPRPWYVYTGQSNDDGEYDAIAISANGKGPNGGWVGLHVARMPVPDDRSFNKRTRAEINANAELIVRCVNEHDALVAALEEAKAALKTAVGHIDHMAAFISTMNEKHNAGYSFESLGEDMWSIRQPLEQEK